MAEQSNEKIEAIINHEHIDPDEAWNELFSELDDEAEDSPEVEFDAEGEAEEEDDFEVEAEEAEEEGEAEEEDEEEAEEEVSEWDEQWDLVDPDTNEPLGKVTSRDLVKVYKQFKESVPHQGQALQQQSQLVGLVSQSPMVQQILAARAQGYTDQQIAQGFYQKFAEQQAYMSQAQQQPQAQPEPREFDTVEEELEYKLNQRLEAERAQRSQELQALAQQNAMTQQQFMAYQQQQQAAAMEAQRRAIEAHNDSMWERSLERVGLSADDITQEHIDALKAAREEYYPGLDLYSNKLSEKQANLIVTEALGDAKRGKSRKPTAKDVNRIKNIPRVGAGQGKSRRSKGDDGLPQMVDEPVSRQERGDRVDELFF